MPNATRELRLGTWLQYDDEDYQLVGIQGTSLHLRSSVGHSLVILQTALFSDPSFKITELADLPQDDPDLEATTSADEGDEPEAPFQRAAVPWKRLDPDRAAFLEKIPDEERDRILTIERHLWDIIQGGNHDIDDDGGPQMTERVKAKAQQVGVSERTVWRWYKAYTVGNANLAGLVDERKVRGRDPLAQLHPKVRDAILELQLQAGQEHTGSKSKFIRRLHRYLELEYAQTAPEVIESIPSDRTLERALTALDAGKHTFGEAVSRKNLADSRAAKMGRLTATRPGEIVMMDTTRLDAMAYDPATDSAISVELSIALDLATRSIVGWRFTPVGTKAIDTVMLLTDVMAPKAMRDRWEDKVRYSFMSVHGERLRTLDERLTSAAALPFVYPEAILVDQGKSYDCGPVKEACAQLGISHLTARKRRGNEKGQVERAFGTIRGQFADHIDGAKGRNTSHRGLDPENLAHFTVPQLEEFFAEMVTIYQHRPHRGLRLPHAPDRPVSPNMMYEALVALAGYVPCPVNPNNYLSLLPVKWRAISRYGVNLDKLVYDDEVLRPYRRHRSPYNHPSGQWPFRVDDRDRRHVYFKDPQTGDWHALQWVGMDDTIGPFSDRLLNHVMGEIQRSGVDQPSQAELKAWLWDLQNRMDTPHAVTKAGRKQIANDRIRQQDLVRDQMKATGVVPPTAPVHTDEDFDVIDPDTGEVFEFDPEALEVIDVYGDSGWATPTFGFDDDAAVS